MREATRRTRGASLEKIVEDLSRYLIGWRAYFGFCETPSVLRALDQWIRRRLRSIVPGSIRPDSLLPPRLASRLIPGSISHWDFQPFAAGSPLATASRIEVALETAPSGPIQPGLQQQKHMFMDGR
ncbi:MAG: hypothetical protein JO223_05565 [Hyphomicrobiales bacterium]|nr:hypothetical protein [Hyphomicrobiales bacterium]